MLETYREKRDFERTPEPAPGKAPSDEGPLTFVVQKHAATRLHYDLRLEIDGALKSWPVPKGPSLDPREKRLAVMVEDHPLDYASFEGVIPKGEYGAGQVIVWDAGTYSPDEGGNLSFDDRNEALARMREGLKKGKISAFLRGHKLKGSWTLVKTRGEKDWLLIKHEDRFADREREVLDEDRSILSGLSIDDLKNGRLPPREQRLLLKPGDLDGARRAPFPRSMEPMHATLTERAFSAADWFFEPKLDGVRGVALVDHGKVRLLSRRGLDATRQYPAVVAELSEQTEPQIVVDGEIVAFDERGVPSFQTLQQRLNLTREPDIRRMEEQIPAYYYVFDLLYAGGYDLRGAPLWQRKRLLRQLLLPGGRVRLVEHFEEEGEAAFQAATSHGLEGIIAKKRESIYESGRRPSTWLKVKTTLEDDFVVGGFTLGTGGREKTLGAILVGQHDERGRLVYAAHVGTGFDEKTLTALRDRLEKLRTDECPFAQAPPKGSRFGRRPASVVTYWVRPELVARVKFAEWTGDGHLRAPSFQGLRPDKGPKDVRREKLVPAPAEAATSAKRDSPSREDIEAVLEQLESRGDRFVLRAQGHKLSLNNLDKEFWPAVGRRRALTKRDLLKYLARVSPFLLNHLRDRPLTLTRYPNGIAGGHFYQKHWEAKLPEFVDTVTLWSEEYQRDDEYLICNNLPTLLWLGQLADLELHTWYSRVNPEPDGHHLPTTFTGSAENFERSLLNHPDFIVFDLDPYIYSGKEKKGAEPELNRRAFDKTLEVANWLKDLLDSLSLSSFIKTSGRTGLHIYVPIRRQFDYDTVRSAAETIGKFILRAHPRDVTMEWSVDKRRGKIFFDHNQNAKGKTLASIYSPRPHSEATVSMPVRWEELRDIYPTDFTILNACDRIEKVGDLWQPILEEKHDLAALLQAGGDGER